ncbi:hypothetical protein CAEBREN_22779 [Caenorhabditis brenneri]|uniref:BTB domain-containing protein n=1 Tax=Caenorhabditis brenneri TaxID=135651 RepID=G0P3J5_CAEBE|nr:hypothetical protein CAEBREN_22779 [Caenorhabditis brenneri]
MFDHRFVIKHTFKNVTELKFLSTQSSHFKHLLMEEEANSPTFTEASSLAQRLVNKTNHAKTQFMDQFKQPGRTKHCIEKFKSAKDVRAAIPLDLSRIDRPLLEEMFKKNLTF